MQMELFEAIKTRKSVRKFTDEEVPAEDIEKIIDAARLAPSATNSQMWRYIVILNKDIKNEIRKEINKAYDEISDWPEALPYQEKVKMYKGYSTFFLDAPVVIAVVEVQKISMMERLFREHKLSDHEVRRRRSEPGMLSIGASVQNLSLAAHALGYGICWLTTPVCAYEKIEELLDINFPNKLVSFLCLGVPEDKNLKPMSKKELKEILTYIR
jgi:nitroreductase